MNMSIRRAATWPWKCANIDGDMTSNLKFPLFEHGPIFYNLIGEGNEWIVRAVTAKLGWIINPVTESCVIIFYCLYNFVMELNISPANTMADLKYKAKHALMISTPPAWLNMTGLQLYPRGVVGHGFGMNKPRSCKIVSAKLCLTMCDHFCVARNFAEFISNAMLASYARANVGLLNHHWPQTTVENPFFQGIITVPICARLQTRKGGGRRVVLIVLKTKLFRYVHRP
jgi:hypothetical protein